MNLPRGNLPRRRTALRIVSVIALIAGGALSSAPARAAAVGSPDVKTEAKKKSAPRSLIKGPKKPLSLNELNAQKAAQAAQAAKAQAAQAAKAQAAKAQASAKKVPSSAPKTAVNPKKAKADWPVAPKEPVNDVLVIDGGHTNPDGSVTIGGTPDEPEAKPSPAPKPPIANVPKIPLAPASVTVAPAPMSAPATEDAVVISDDEGGGEVSIGDESAAGADGEIALDFGADLESGFNPYVFDRGLTWMFLPVFGLIILGLHLIPVPKRKMKKLIAQTGLFRGLPGKEETRTDLKAPESMRRATPDKKLNETKPMEARKTVPPRPEIAVEVQAIPEPKAIPVPPRPSAGQGSSIGKVKVKTLPVAMPVKTEPKHEAPAAEMDGPTRVADTSEMPPLPDPDDVKTRVVSMAESLAEAKENEDNDDEDEATRLYVTKKTSRGGREEA